MEDKPELSIIVPVYNGEKNIEKCINSILESTYKNYEIIIINDGSTDKTIKILQKFNNITNIKIINKNNEGVSIARNIGIDYATGIYTTFVDSDDMVDKNYYINAINQIKETMSDLATCSYIVNGKEETIDYVKKESSIKVLSDLINNDQFKFFNIVWNKIYITSKLKNIKFDKKLKMGEDVIFNLQYLTKCQHITCCQKAYYIYNFTNQNVTNKMSNNYSPNYELDKELYFMKEYEKLFKLNKIKQKDINIIMHKSCINSFFKIIKNIYLCDDKNKKQKIKKIYEANIYKEYITKTKQKSLKELFCIICFKFKTSSLVFLYFAYQTMKEIIKNIIVIRRNK